MRGAWAVNVVSLLGPALNRAPGDGGPEKSRKDRLASLVTRSLGATVSYPLNLLT